MPNASLLCASLSYNLDNRLHRGFLQAVPVLINILCNPFEAESAAAQYIGTPYECSALKLASAVRNALGAGALSTYLYSAQG